MDPNDKRIPAPVDEAYGSYEEAFNALKQHGLCFGWGFYKTDSRSRYLATRTRIYYSCDKARQYTLKVEIRDIVSQADNCPFKLIIYQVDIQWKLKVLNKDHSYPPSLNLSTYYIHYKRIPA